MHGEELLIALSYFFEKIRIADFTCPSAKDPRVPGEGIFRRHCKVLQIWRKGYDFLQFTQTFQIVGVEQILVHLKTEVGVESADNFAGKLDMGRLVFAHRDEQLLLWLAVHDDVGGLQERVAQETVGAEVAILEILDLLFVGWDALEPA